MRNLEDIKDIPEITVSLEEQVKNILMKHIGNAFTISGIILEISGGFRVEMFSKISQINRLDSLDQFSNIFEYYALVFHILEELAKNDPKIKTKTIFDNYQPIKFYWYQDQ